MEQLLEPDEPDDVPTVEVQITTTAPGVLTVALGGELDLSTVDEVADEVGRSLHPRPARMILDIAALSFADSAAITLWLSWAGAVDHFELRDPRPVIRQVLIAMGLAQKLGLSP